MSPTLRRGAALLATSVLTLSGLAMSASPASAAVHDPAPGDASAGWLTGQLTNGLMHNPNYGGFDDYGLSIDAALGLTGLGGHDSTVQTISDAVAAHIGDYVTGNNFGDPGSTYAGPTGKAIVLAQTAGDDPTSFGGDNLVTRLEARVSSDPKILGRIEDQSTFGDFANAIGQAFAVEGLTAAGSTRAPDALTYLLKQQCSAGYFRLDFTKSKTATDQTCDGGKATGDSPADTDVTALVVLALHGDPAGAAAVAKAEQWLKDHQKSDGSFGGGPATEASNANSTGLAGWALGVLGDTGRAERAAAWVRHLQVVNVGACAPYDNGDQGALAYDAAGLGGAAKEGITDATSDQFRRASSQALAVLQWAPAATGEAQVPASPGYVKAGSRHHVVVTGLAPGAAACATLAGRNTQAASNVSGRALPAVLVPQGTRDRVVHVTDAAGAVGSVRLHVLGALKVPFSLARQSVARGARQTVHAHGLAPREHVSVRFHGNRVAVGRASSTGVFTARFLVTGRRGDATVTVLGQFPDIRRNTKHFTVR